MASGPFTEDDLGVSCCHSKTGAVELYLNHLVDAEDEYVSSTRPPAPTASCAST